MLQVLNQEAIRDNRILDAEDLTVLVLVMFHYLADLLTLQFILLSEAILSLYSGHETITLEDSFDLHGHLLLNLIAQLLSTLMFNKLTAMKSEDAIPMTPLTLTEEILDLEMDLLEPALQSSKYLLI